MLRVTILERDGDPTGGEALDDTNTHSENRPDWQPKPMLGWPGPRSLSTGDRKSQLSQCQDRTLVNNIKCDRIYSPQLSRKCARVRACVLE